MATDAAANKRASFARADRLKKESAGQSVEQVKTTRTAEEQQRAAARLTTRRRDAEAKKIERQKVADAKKESARQDEQKKADQARAADRAKEAQQQTEAQARAAEVRRRAVAFIAARERAQQADQLAAHRHQTGQLRTGHRAEMQSHRENEVTGYIHHAAKMGAIDAAERRDLQAMDDRRRSLGGRIAGIVRPSRFEREERVIRDRHESDRMTKHRDHEALKERQFIAAQTARLRQAHERKAMFEQHRSATASLRRTQETNRPREIEQRQQTFERAAKLEQAYSQRQERGQGLAR